MKRQSVLAAVALLCLCCCAMAQSSNSQPVAAGQRKEPVKTGEIAPDFTLEDFRVENDEWSKVTLSSARGQSPVVLVFYRGHW